MENVDPEATIETKTLDLPARLLTTYDNEDDAWSWGLSPRIVQIQKKIDISNNSLLKQPSKISPVQSQRIRSQDDCEKE